MDVDCAGRIDRAPSNPRLLTLTTIADRTWRNSRRWSPQSQESKRGSGIGMLPVKTQRICHAGAVLQGCRYPVSPAAISGAVACGRFKHKT